MFTEKNVIEFCDCDFTGKIRPDYYFVRFGEIATQDAYQIGIYKRELEGHYGWIVSKQTLKLAKKLGLGDILEFSTQPMKGSFVIFPRYYQITQDNEVVGECFSQWTLLDLIKRRIARVNKAGITLPKSEAMKENPKTLLFEEEMECVASYQVKYSDLDGNGHMNNTKYIVASCNLMNLDYFKNHYLKEISINYKKEASPLTMIDLYYSQRENIIHVKGMLGDEECFLLEMIWEEDND